MIAILARRCSVRNFSTMMRSSRVKTIQQVTDALAAIEKHAPKTQHFYKRLSYDWLDYLNRNQKISDSEVSCLENEIALLSCMNILVASGDKDSLFPMTLSLIRDSQLAMSQTLLDRVLATMCARDIDNSGHYLSQLIQEMQLKPTTRTLNYLISECQNKAKKNLAMYWLKRFRDEFHVLPDTVTMNILLKLFSNKDSPADCLRLFERLTSEYRLIPDAITIQTMLHSCARARDIESSFKLLKIIQHRLHFRCTSRTLGAILGGAGEIGDTDSMERWMDVATTDLNIVPNVVCINILISAYAQKGDSKMALFWFQQMAKWSISPNCKSMGALLNAYVASGLMGEAECMWRTLMVDHEYNPNIVMFDIMLVGYLKYGTVDHCTAWLDRLCDYRLNPSETTIGIALQVYSKARDIMNVEKWLTQLVDRAKFVSNRRSVWLAIDCLAKANKLASVRFWMNRLQNIGIDPDVMMYTSLIDSNASRGKKIEMLQDFDSMVKLGIRPSNITVNVLLKGFTRAKPATRWPEIINFINSMKNEFNFVPDNFSYHQLLLVCAKNKFVEEAIQLFNELTASKLYERQLFVLFCKAVGKEKFLEHCGKHENLHEQLHEIIVLAESKRTNTKVTQL